MNALHGVVRVLVKTDCATSWPEAVRGKLLSDRRLLLSS